MLTYSEACVRGYGWWERQQTADKQSRDLIARVDASWWRHKRDFSVPLLLFDMSDGLYFSWVSALKTKIFIRGGADKSLARPTSRCRRMESIVSLERGVCSCAELLVFSCYRGWKEACQATRTISITSRRELSSTIFVLQGKASKEIHAILTETLGEHAPLYATVENWVAHFKRGDFSTCDAPRPGRPKTGTTLGIIDQIHGLILEDRRISTKSIAEHLEITCERVGSIFRDDLDMRTLSAKWVPKRLNADQNVNSASRLSKFGIFSTRSKWFPVAIGDDRRNLVTSLWSRDKATINGMAV